MTDIDHALTKIDAIQHAIAERQTLPELKEYRDQAEAIRQYIKVQGGKLEEQNYAAEAKIRAERRAGELLAAMDKNRGTWVGGSIVEPPDETPTLAELGIERKQSHRWQLEASVPEERFEQYIAETTDNQEELTSAGLLRIAKGQSVHFSSETDEWYTPPGIIQRTLKVFAQIDLDPCSNDGEPNVPAGKHYTQEDDGLEQEWHGRVYMNPPYGREIGQWVSKLMREFITGNVTDAIALVPARTDTEWFAAFRDCAVCFIRGRLKFSGQENSAPFPSAVVYAGTDIDKFVEAFSDLGDIWERIDK